MKQAHESLFDINDPEETRNIFYFFHPASSVSSASTVWILIISSTSIAVILIIAFISFHHFPSFTSSPSSSSSISTTTTTSFFSHQPRQPDLFLSSSLFPLFLMSKSGSLLRREGHTVWLTSQPWLRQNHISAQQGSQRESHILTGKMSCSLVYKMRNKSSGREGLWCGTCKGVEMCNSKCV